MGRNAAACCWSFLSVCSSSCNDMAQAPIKRERQLVRLDRRGDNFRMIEFADECGDGTLPRRRGAFRDVGDVGVRVADAMSSRTELIACFLGWQNAAAFFIFRPGSDTRSVKS